MVVSGSAPHVAAQVNQTVTESTYQSWWDVDFRYPLAPGWLAFSEVGARVLVSDSLGWSSVRLTPGVEHAVNGWLDLLAFVPLIGTVQQEGIRTFEVRPVGGVRLTGRPHPRVVLRNRTLAEYRFIDFLDQDLTQTSLRLRSRVELRVAINRPTFSTKQLLYGITDIEGFMNVGDVPSERFLNRFRYRLGLGYRFDRWWATEAIYTLQTSRNTLEDVELTTRDHIIRFRLVHFLR